MNSIRSRKRFQSSGGKATSGTQSSTKITRAGAGTARRSSTETRSERANSIIAASRSETKRRAASGTERKTRTKHEPKSGTEREREIPTERESGSASGTNGGTGRERESVTRMERPERKVERASAVRYATPRHATPPQHHTALLKCRL